MTIVAAMFDHVVGIDTHARSHTLCIVETRTGAVIDVATFPTTKPGLARALAWIQRRCSEGGVLAAVEGTSSYGASIAATLESEGIEVTEVRPASKAAHAHAGKSDSIDAEWAARSVIGRDYDRLARPRQGGKRGALRVLLAARHLIDHQRTANRNALIALVRSCDINVDGRRPLSDAQLRTIAAWRVGRGSDSLSLVRREARRLATAVLEQMDLLAVNRRQLQLLSEELAPGLQETPGVGPVAAAILICAYSHRGRVRSEAAFATLAGVAPLPASSGNTNRHRLSRSGDRQLNRALDVIVRTRMSFDGETRVYVLRRTAEGRTNREIRRSLKRYVCRSVFRQLEAAMA
jgi:transposase